MKLFKSITVLLLSMVLIAGQVSAMATAGAHTQGDGFSAEEMAADCSCEDASPCSMNCCWEMPGGNASPALMAVGSAQQQLQIQWAHAVIVTALAPSPRKEGVVLPVSTDPPFATAVPLYQWQCVYLI